LAFAGRCSIGRNQRYPGGLAASERAFALSGSAQRRCASENKILTPPGLLNHQQIRALRPHSIRAAPADSRWCLLCDLPLPGSCGFAHAGCSTRWCVAGNHWRTSVPRHPCLDRDACKQNPRPLVWIKTADGSSNPSAGAARESRDHDGLADLDHAGFGRDPGAVNEEKHVRAGRGDLGVRR
jgi:hypothetical protein